jgi:hypothetical protein
MTNPWEEIIKPQIAKGGNESLWILWKYQKSEER